MTGTIGLHIALYKNLVFIYLVSSFPNFIPTYSELITLHLDKSSNLRYNDCVDLSLLSIAKGVTYDFY